MSGELLRDSATGKMLFHPQSGSLLFSIGSSPLPTMRIVLTGGSIRHVTIDLGDSWVFATTNVDGIVDGTDDVGDCIVTLGGSVLGKIVFGIYGIYVTVALTHPGVWSIAIGPDYSIAAIIAEKTGASPIGTYTITSIHSGNEAINDPSSQGWIEAPTVSIEEVV